MKYPSISSSACERLAAQKLDDLNPVVDMDRKWLGVGEEVDLQPAIDAARRFDATVELRRSASDRDKVEGMLAPILQDALVEVPVEVLDDPGFWRYLSIAHYWDFIAWREEKPFKAGNHLRYVDCRVSTESVLPRMYLRAKAVGGPEHGSLSHLLDNATDFWRSHVLRVKTSTSPPVTRAFVRTQAGQKVNTDTIREIARGMNRTWANRVIVLLDEDDAAEVVEDLFDSIATGTE